MRIVSWNMNHARRTPEARAKAWDYLRHELKADVALVQEAVPPAGVDAVYLPIHESNRHYNWGSAVVALGAGVGITPRPRVPLASWDLGERPADALPDSHPGAAAVADILYADGNVRFTAVSLYGQWEMTGGDKDFHACAKVHRILSDLTDVLAQSRKRPVVVAGDFNLTTQLERVGQNHRAADGARAAFDRLRAWGLSDCLVHTRAGRSRLAGCVCADGDACSHVQTYRHGNRSDSHPVQLDYAFASTTLLPTIVGCRAVHDDAAWALSDHCPIVVDLQ
jgi:exonuclease III